MGQLEADEDLADRLRPLQHGGCLHMFLLLHPQFLQHLLVGLDPVVDNPQQLLVVMLLVVVELPEAVQGLGQQVNFVRQGLGAR